MMHYKPRMTNKENQEELIELAEKACDKFDGFAQIGSTKYAFVDTTKYDVEYKMEY